MHWLWRTRVSGCLQQIAGPLLACPPLLGVPQVYSSRRCGKGHCFDLVQQRWGADARYVVIGASVHLGEGGTLTALLPSLAAPSST